MEAVVPLPGLFQRTKTTASLLSSVSATPENYSLWNSDADLDTILKQLEKNGSNTVELLQRITAQLTNNLLSHTDFIRIGGVQTLAALLASDNPNVQLKALSVLEVLADNPRNAVALLQQGVLSLLVHILTSPRYNGRRKALTADIIKCLGGGEEAPNSTDSVPEGPMAQLSLLDATPPRPRTLPVWCYSVNHDLKWDSEVIINLVDILAQGGLGDLEAALAHALTRITLVRSMGGPLVVEPPVMEALISLLYGMHPCVRQILHVLVALCILHPLNEALLLKLPAVAALAFVASCDTKGGAMGELTAWVLAFLAARSKEAAKRVAASEAVEVLVQMLYSEEVGTREAATRAVSCLAATDSRKMAPVRRKLVRANAVPGLLSVLQAAEQNVDDHRATIIDIMRAFWKMRGVKECRDEMKVAGVLEALQGLARGPDGEVAFLAAQVLHGLSMRRRRLAPIMRVVKCGMPISVQLSQQRQAMQQLPHTASGYHVPPSESEASHLNTTHLPRATSLAGVSSPASSARTSRGSLMRRLRIKMRKLIVRLRMRSTPALPAGNALEARPIPSMTTVSTNEPESVAARTSSGGLPTRPKPVAYAPPSGANHPVLDAPEPQVLSPTRYNATLRSTPLGPPPQMRPLAAWEPPFRNASAASLQDLHSTSGGAGGRVPSAAALEKPAPSSVSSPDVLHSHSTPGTAVSGAAASSEEEAEDPNGARGTQRYGAVKKRVFRNTTSGRYARI